MTLAFHTPLPAEQRQGPLSLAAALPLACGGCLAASALYVAIDDPSDSGGLTPCPIRALTGQWCPGCGLTRATHQLLRGNVLQALSFNVFVPAILAGLVALWVVWLRVATGHGVPHRILAIRTHTYVAAGVLLAAFVVVRNVAGFQFLRGG